MCEYLKGVVGSSLPLPIHRTPPPLLGVNVTPKECLRGCMKSPTPPYPLHYPPLFGLPFSCYFQNGVYLVLSGLLYDLPLCLGPPNGCIKTFNKLPTPPYPPLIIPCLGWVTVSVTTHIQFKQRRRNINNNLYKIK